jgi:L-alanine-DL-glutamate epimerase-like enolase superfamily enzyme
MDSGPQEVIERLHDLDPYNIYWYEDFLPPDDYAGYARAKETSAGTRLAAGEQEILASGFRRLIEQGRIDIIQPDLSRCGGLTEFRRIVCEAERAAVDICPHVWLTDLLTAASLHASICLKRSLFLEFNVSASPVLRDIIHNPIVLDKDGTLTVPEGPGLGIDEDAINCYRIA